MKTFDAVIAGGGLIGAAIARELSRMGMRVAIFEAKQPVREASWASAGILSPAPENPAMIGMVPLGKASLAMYPEFIQSIEETTGMLTGFRPKGTVEALFSRHAKQELNTIVALHHGLGLKAEAISAVEAREWEPSLSEDVEAAVLRPEEASVDNRQLGAALLEAAKRGGTQVFADSPVHAIRQAGDRCDGFVLRNGDLVSSSHAIIAAGCFSSQICGVAELAPVRPAKGQMVSLRCPAARIERVLWSERIYLVPRNDGRILAGATIEQAGFDRTVTAFGIQANLTGAIELAPILGQAQVEETWAGLRPDTPDHMPILGPTGIPGLTIATGHFRSGVLLTPITARLVAEHLSGQPLSADWDRFSPLRFEGTIKTRHATAQDVQ